MDGRCKTKICGTTSRDDAVMAADAGADFFGAVIEVDFSPRSLTMDQARPLFADPPIPGIALVFHMAPARIETVIRKLAPSGVQFLAPADTGLMTRLKAAHPHVALWQSIHLPEAGETADIERFRDMVAGYVAVGVDALVFDTVAVMQGKTKFGGTGRTSDWQVVRRLMAGVDNAVPVWLAGGIHPGNVREALGATSPYGIDLCSGVEARPGKKDPAKIAALMSAVRAAAKTH